MPHFDCTADNSLLLVIDVQERFVSAIPSIAADGALGQQLRLLMDGCNLYPASGGHPAIPQGPGPIAALRCRGTSWRGAVDPWRQNPFQRHR